MKIAEPRPFERCFLCTGFAYNAGEQLSADVQTFANVALRCQSIRRDGAAALDLALVARGIFDGFWEPGLQPWDVAAGSLLVTEAGGLVTNYQPRRTASYDLENESIVAGNRQTVDFLHGLIETKQAPRG